MAEALLTNRGYETVWGETTRLMVGYLAGNDLMRRADLERMSNTMVEVSQQEH